MSGLSASGLPLSIQWVGRAFEEPMLLRVGAAYERESGSDAFRPSLAEPA
jgi:aspartyl-tRNA(Asn)/glutamyl-tRNA(Gln) amidotransferase subunit A